MEELKAFEGKKIRSVWDEEKQRWFFSVVDVVEILTESVDASAYWRKLKQRLKLEGNESVTNCHGLKMLAADGKMRMTDVLDTEGVLRLVQSIPSPKAEPFKTWLANVGYERLEEIANPELAINRMREIYLEKGYSEEWIETRLKSIDIRKSLTDEWGTRGIVENREYAILTAEISKGTFGMTPGAYKRYKNLTNPLDNHRDHMTETELLFTMLGEVTARRNSRNTNAQGFKENFDAAHDAGKAAGAARRAFEDVQKESVVSSSNFKDEPEKKQRNKVRDE